ncbi:MAG: insulinase family protein [Desulfuromonadales bacterium]|nr:insulinase family protein [Desulfuromonadales bacterium]
MRLFSKINSILKRALPLLLAAAITLPAVTSFAAPETKDPRKLTFQPLKFSIPKSDRVVLKNGMILYLLEDHELPIVNATAYINTGSIYDPQGKAGLAAITGSIMRDGGAGKLSPEQLNDELAFMASSVEVNIGTDLGNVSMSCLARNLDSTLELFSQIILDPAFDNNRLELIKNNFIEGINRQNDDPKEIANRELTKAIYEGHPLGIVPTLKSINNITRQDIIDFHKRYFNPKGMILAISGDFQKEQIIKDLEKFFPTTEEKAVMPDIPAPDKNSSGKILFAKKEVSQSVIRMGHLSVDKNNPDQYAIRVLDYILGGSFTSRLMQQIRSDQGLAYNVTSRFDIGRRFPGTFVISTETKSASTIKVIGLIDNILTDLRTNEVSKEELNQAKEAIINSFIFGFTTASSVVNLQARLEYFGFPKGYLENFRDNIAKVSREDILKAAKNYIRPDLLTIVVVGDDKQFDKSLSTVGNVQNINLEIK